jgi:hypothetical protein
MCPPEMGMLLPALACSTEAKYQNDEALDSHHPLDVGGWYAGLWSEASPPY